jgi:hypothetical protein
MGKGGKSTFRVKSKKETPLIKWLDVFMERYGMTMKEFEELPIPTFYALAHIIIEEAEEMNKK